MHTYSEPKEKRHEKKAHTAKWKKNQRQEIALRWFGSSNRKNNLETNDNDDYGVVILLTNLIKTESAIISPRFFLLFLLVFFFFFKWLSVITLSKCSLPFSLVRFEMCTRGSARVYTQPLVWLVGSSTSDSHYFTSSEKCYVT